MMHSILLSGCRTVPQLLNGLLPVLILVSIPFEATSQVPAKCFEIESILVDACTAGGQCVGASEGANEMVRFFTGPYPIALSDISIQWPNNSYQGLIQNASSASLTAALNASIEACGFLLEPPNGIIPSGSRVLLITSTDMCLEANSFSALSDTLYVVYQFPGNTAGHFANQNNGSNISPVPTGGVSLRTLIMTYLPNACGDTATYDRQGLMNIYGTYGGSSAENDGATARFAWPGEPVASYVNNGCQAPFIPLSIDILSDGGSIPCESPLMLQGSASSGFTSLTWSGGTGTFSDPTALVSSYTIGAGDTGSITLFLCATGLCAQVLCDSVTFSVDGTPDADITADGPLDLCPGDQLILTASGGDSYVWSTGEATASIVIDGPGDYSVEVTGACGTDEANLTVSSAPVPQAGIAGDTVICQGENAVLVGSGGTDYSWSTGETTQAITTSSPGVYSVTVSNACGTDQASITLTNSLVAVSAIASPSFGPAPLSVVFSAVVDPPAVSWVWDLGNGLSSTSESPIGLYTTPGTYEVTVNAVDANGCLGSSVLGVTVNEMVPSTLVVPNVFSPNGDGQNDMFKILSEGLIRLHVSIFDRWGQQIASIGRTNEEWNGRSASGDVVADGTYFFILAAEGADGRSYQQHGSITVLR